MNGRIVDGTNNLITKYRTAKGFLTPCPFCGSQELTPKQTRPETLTRPKVYWVNCSTCKATGPDMDSLDEAIAKWEARV